MPTGIPTKLKKCVICGEDFLPKKPSQRICKKDHINHCPVCGKEMIWNTTEKIKPCSRNCSRELTKQKNIEKYGVPHPMQNEQVKKNFANAMMQKYGVEHALQDETIKQRAISTNNERLGCDWALQNPTVKAKAISTMIDRYGAPTTLQSDVLKSQVKSTILQKYGVDSIIKAESIKAKIDNTNLKKYGTVYITQNEAIKKKIRDTRIKRYGDIWSKEMKIKSQNTCMLHYGVTNPSFCPEIIDKIANTMLRKYGVKSAIMVPEFRQKMVDTIIERYPEDYYITTDNYPFLISHTISKTNEKFSELLNNHNIEHTMEFSQLPHRRYDFAITDTNILLEINPSYTHNIIGSHFNPKGLDEKYHLEKSNLAAEHGYRCIHIFDWDDKEKIINLLTTPTKLFARKCDIRNIDRKICDEFLNQYHLQNTCKGQKVRLGLFYQDELVEVMTFGKPRYNKKYEWELLRLCTKHGYQVIGGTSKLFQHFIQNYDPQSIISYCDKSKFIGDVYIKIGFKHIRDTQPTIHWSKKDKQISHNLLLRNGYDRLFNTNYGKDASNEYLMLQNRWLPVCDCGMAVFEYKRGCE